MAMKLPNLCKPLPQASGSGSVILPMLDEVSHVAQWVELTQRAKNHKLYVGLHNGGFGLWAQSTPSRLRARDLIGTYHSFFELRRAISDHVAASRRNQPQEKWK